MIEVKKTGLNKIYDEIQINAQPSEEHDGITNNNSQISIVYQNGPFRWVDSVRPSLNDRKTLSFLPKIQEKSV